LESHRFDDYKVGFGYALRLLQKYRNPSEASPKDVTDIVDFVPSTQKRPVFVGFVPFSPNFFLFL
jgi:hypothetical protein